MAGRTGKFGAVAAVASFCVPIDDRQTVILTEWPAQDGSSAGTLAFAAKYRRGQIRTGRDYKDGSKKLSVLPSRPWYSRNDLVVK